MSHGLWRIGGKHIMPPAIRAIDRALLCHRQKYARMTERAIAAVAVELFGVDGDGFGWLHGCLLKIKS